MFILKTLASADRIDEGCIVLMWLQLLLPCVLCLEEAGLNFEFGDEVASVGRSLMAGLAGDSLAT